MAVQQEGQALVEVMLNTAMARLQMRDLAASGNGSGGGGGGGGSAGGGGARPPPPPPQAPIPGQGGGGGSPGRGLGNAVQQGLILASIIKTLGTTFRNLTDAVEPLRRAADLAASHSPNLALGGASPAMIGAQGRAFTTAFEATQNFSERAMGFADDDTRRLVFDYHHKIQTMREGGRMQTEQQFLTGGFDVTSKYAGGLWDSMNKFGVWGALMR